MNHYKSINEFEILFNQEQIKNICSKMADEIRKTYPANEPLVCIGVLKGAWMFLADLARELKRPVEIDFIRAKSYHGGTHSTGTVHILKDIETDIRAKHVLLVEEIIDTGRTLSFIKQRLASSDAKSVKIAALLDKKDQREVPCEADFVGSVIPNKFVVGYGLDWSEELRDLPAIYAVPEKFYKK